MKSIEEFIQGILIKILSRDGYPQFDYKKISELQERVKKGNNEMLEVFKFLEFCAFFDRYIDLDQQCEFFTSPLYINYHDVKIDSETTKKERVYSAYDPYIDDYRYFIFECEYSDSEPIVKEVDKYTEYIEYTWFE